MDYHSKFPELSLVQSKNASSVIKAMKNVFACQGIPEILIADNMPFGAQEFRKFANEWNFQLVTSSPRYPQSNGLAEKYVGILKMMLRKCHEDNLFFVIRDQLHWKYVGILKMMLRKCHEDNLFFVIRDQPVGIIPLLGHP